MGTPKLTVLVVGATGSIGRLVEVEALRQGHAERALVRDDAVRDTHNMPLSDEPGPVREDLKQPSAR